MAGGPGRKKLRNAALALTGEGGECPVLPCNWPPVRLFAACATQWRHHPSGGRAGLDYQGAMAAAAALEVAWDARTLSALRVMEEALLDALNGP